MYKITLMDETTPAFVSFSRLFFTDDINQFYNDWSQLETDEKKKERFLRSLSGEIVTDHYSDDEKINIVQCDDGTETIKEQRYCFVGITKTLTNAYDCEHQIYIHKLFYTIKLIRFKDKFYKIAKYKMEGVAEIYENLFLRRECYGNPILKTVYADDGRLHKEKAALFDNSIESICYVCLNEYDSLDEIEKGNSDDLTEEEFQIMTMDICGEAG